MQELYFVNESIYLERNAINFRNNRMLADADKKFDLNNFYESTLSRANQFSDYIGNDKEIKNLRNIIDSRIKEHKGIDTSPNLNNVDEKKKKLIYELRKEIEKAQKEFENVRNSELGILPIQNKRITKKDGNISILECKDSKKFEKEGNFLEGKDDSFEDEYNEIILRNNYKESKHNRKFTKILKKIFKMLGIATTFLAIILSGGLIIPFILLITQDSFDEFMKRWIFYESYTKKSKK
ncbi:fam-b protein [Plasmodium vinckei vinckei]|uniref:Fam-b protein n=1 Tax=Plasmodium vinckei vinckei TaxID=54757 RepID=A0A449BM55_PLAVN|nr:fam-b protein [Plasmodium vinckei vinckei]VEV54530.1 fam-b protein [Plasmodium vinckei vinckei]